MKNLRSHNFRTHDFYSQFQFVFDIFEPTLTLPKKIIN